MGTKKRPKKQQFGPPIPRGFVCLHCGRIVPDGPQTYTVCDRATGATIGPVHEGCMPAYKASRKGGK